MAVRYQNAAVLMCYKQQFIHLRDKSLINKIVCKCESSS